MCELFAMSSRQPATVNFSLDTFARHGGGTAPHKDGWGVAYYEEGDVRCIKDTAAADGSPWVQFLEEQGLCSTFVISHIRKATIGPTALKNTQPFCRELGGRMHVFAHNGHLPGIAKLDRFSHGSHRPVGDTDSELAFCALLHRLAEMWLSASEPPPLKERFERVATFAAELRSLGLANFLYSDGNALFAHGHRRQQANNRFEPPGLFRLFRECPANARSEEGAGVTLSGPRQHVTLVASVPLTQETWHPLKEGEVLAISAGRTAMQAST